MHKKGKGYGLMVVCQFIAREWEIIIENAEEMLIQY
jgi:hypothetical protein